MARRIEDVDSVIIGKQYDVPCVGSITWKMFVPVMGPLHEDRELLKFPDDHWHIDWRFVSNRFYEDQDYTIIGHYAIPVSEQNTNGLIVRRVLTCKREFGIFPDPLAKRLEPHYIDAKLKNGICPHRGFSCKQFPVDEKGCVVCPGHGLKWDVATGEMVSRNGQHVQRRIAFK